MVFLKNLVSVGNGRLSSSVYSDGVIKMYIQNDNTISYKGLDSLTLKISGSRVVSYADDYVETNDRAVERYCNGYEITNL